MPGKKILIGTITSPHGLKGEVKIKTFLESPKDLTNFNNIYDVGNKIKFKILDIRGIKNDVAIVKFEGFDNRDKAETIRGKKLYIDEGELPNITNDDEFYHKDIIGLNVIQDGEMIGKVNGLYNYGAGDMIEIKLKDSGLEAIPFNSDYVKNVDVQKGIIEIILPVYI